MVRPGTRGVCAAVLALGVLGSPAWAVPVTYRLQAYGTGATGSLGGVPFSNATVVLTFDGDTADVVPYSVPGASGYLILKGTASISLQQGYDPPTIATFLPSAGVYVSVDGTNSGIGFGSAGVLPGAPTFPGQPVYPASMFTSTGAVATYDLASDVTVTGFPVSCVDFATPAQCAAAIPLATSAGDLLLNVFSAGNGVFFAQTHPASPFSSFDVEGAVGGRPPDRFSLEGSFTLGTGSDGIDPLTQPVTISVGAYTATIPAGSFQSRRGGFAFSGPVGDASLKVRLTPHGAGTYVFAIEARGAALGSLVNPVTIGLSIGDDLGSASIRLGRSH